VGKIREKYSLARAKGCAPQNRQEKKTAGEESAFVPQRIRSATPFRKIDSFSNPVSKSNFRPEPMKDFAPHYASAPLAPGGQPPPLRIIPQRSPDPSKSIPRWGEDPKKENPPRMAARFLPPPIFYGSLSAGQGIFAHQHRRDKGFLKPFSLISAKKGERGPNQ